MIPKEVIDVTEGPYFGYLGTRNEALTPAIQFLWGLTFQAAENIATAFVVAAQSNGTLANLEANGRVALSYSDTLTHVAYQLKGHFLRARPLDAAETALQQSYQSSAVGILKEMGYEEALVKTVIVSADLAIDIQIETIFNQTPGPGAGKEVTF